MATNPFKSHILLDTGISMGDEGKGRLIPEVIRELIDITGQKAPVGAVVKVNGGANSGHTSGGLKLNLFPAGVVETCVPVLAIGSGVVADPHKFLWEAAYIEKHGYKVRNRLLIDQRTMVSDLSHRLLDLAFENYRVNVIGEDKRGSTGRGISPSYSDETSHFPIYYNEFNLGKEAFSKKFQARIERALKVVEHVCQVSTDDWFEFFETLTTAEKRANKELIDSGLFDESAFDFTQFTCEEPFKVRVEELIDAYWTAGQELKLNVGDVREHINQALGRGEYIIGEFGQAFWLDKRFGFPPNVTASHTLPAEFFLSTGVPLQKAHTLGVCKAYDTKVGTHVFLCEFPEAHPLGKKLAKLEYGTTTGRQRMVGWFDAVEKGDAIRYGGCDDLVINKLDALTYSNGWSEAGELLICIGYEDANGKRIKHVPRDPETHCKLKPVYKQFPGWKEDISTVRNFDKLPENAKAYVANMVKATMDVAFDGESLNKVDLPRLRYIGVGPDPDQIIRDIPETTELLKLA